MWSNTKITEILQIELPIIQAPMAGGATTPELIAAVSNTGGLGSLGALPVALLVTVIGMGLGGPTGYAINPARDLAPRIMHSILPMGKKGSGDWSYSWIPVVGPILGGVLAAALFLILK